MNIQRFLSSYVREHRKYPSLSDLREGMGDYDLSDEDEEFLQTAQDIPEDIFNNPDYHVQALLTYRDNIESVMMLYQGEINRDTLPHGEW